VGMIGRQQERLEACRASILEAVPDANVCYVAADATDPGECARAFEQLAAAHGKPECLVYNLSSRPFPKANVVDVAPSRLEADFKTGAYGALLCSQQVLPAMREAGKGTVLFTGASASLRGSAGFGSFAVAKHGLRVLAQSLAKEVGPEGVHVSHVVVDAMVDMPVVRGLVDMPEDRLLDPAAAAEVYWQLFQQQKRCFTFEVDVRPCLSQW